MPDGKANKKDILLKVVRIIQNDFKKLGRNKVFSILRNQGANPITIRIENQQHRVWVIKEFEKEPDIPERKVVERKDPF